jgi:hypothetical protein
MGKEKTILFSTITIVDAVKSYSGTFSLHDVTVNSEYTSDLAGQIRWDFDEDYEIGGWREYNGTGTADFTIKRVGCGEAVTFARLPVESRLKVSEDESYEFQVGVVGDDEVTRVCRHPDLDKNLTWEESFTSAGAGMTSTDPCGEREFYPRYSEVTDLTFARNGSCSNNVINRFQIGWSFKALE